MGCDIHLFVEKRSEDGAWELLPEQKIPCLECACDFRYGNSRAGIEILRDFRSIFPADRNLLMSSSDDASKEIVFTQDDVDRFYGDCDCCNNTRSQLWSSFYKSRNYFLFSILAGVRNYGNDIEPIGPRRGVPEDASPEYKHEVEYQKGDGHSHSWFTLDELLKFPWKEKVILGEGIVPTEEYLRWKAEGKQGQPWAYSRMVDRKDVVVVNEDEMDALVESGTLVSTIPGGTVPYHLRHSSGYAKDGKRYYARVEFTTPYADGVPKFLEALEALKSRGKPEDIRLVFFFDN